MNNSLALTVADICHHIGAQTHALANNQYAEGFPIAEDWYKKALRLLILNGGEFEKRCSLHNNLMYVTGLQRKYDEAIEHATMAMKSKTKLVIGPRYVRALFYLMKNDYENGFREFECRWDEDGLSKLCKIEGILLWEGQKCNSLHVFAEQGYGDIFQFSRYIPLIQKRFGIDKIYYEVPKACLSLMQYNFDGMNGVEVITSEDRVRTQTARGIDYTIQAMSLAYRFGTTFETVPQFKINPEPEYIEKWKHLDGKSIAVCWGGRAENGDWRATEWNGRRNIDPRTLCEAIGNHPIIALQKEFNHQIETWSDTAGIIANSKLVISIDSGPVHLAAAMDCCPVWLLNHYQSCWRYTVDRPTTPWYPNLLIYRQEKEGDWSGVLKKVRENMK